MINSGKQIKNIDEYITSFPSELQGTLEKIRQTIKKAAPEAEEAIKYQMPTFRLNGNLVHFAAYQKHIGFYPSPSAIESFKDELAAFKTSKGAIQFPIDKPIPFDLIKRITEFRVSQNQKI